MNARSRMTTTTSMSVVFTYYKSYWEFISKVDMVLPKRSFEKWYANTDFNFNVTSVWPACMLSFTMIWLSVYYWILLHVQILWYSSNTEVLWNVTSFFESVRGDLIKIRLVKYWLKSAPLPYCIAYRKSLFFIVWLVGEGGGRTPPYFSIPFLPCF